MKIKACTPEAVRNYLEIPTVEISGSRLISDKFVSTLNSKQSTEFKDT